MAHASGKSAGRSSFGKWAVHIAALLFVIVWTIPTLGILVTSLRDKDQIVGSGWWNSFFSSTQVQQVRLAGPDKQVEKDGKFVIEGNVFENPGGTQVSAFGARAQEPTSTPQISTEVSSAAWAARAP